MKIQYNKNLKRNDLIELDLPNMRDKYQIPYKIRLESNSKIEFCLLSNKTSLLRYSEPYFKTYQEISLKDYQTRLSDGENFQITIKNTYKEPQDIAIDIEYVPFTGNILFTQTFNKETLLSSSENLGDYGQITKLLFKTNIPIKTIKLVPVYSSDSKNWIKPIDIEVSDTNHELDLTKEYRQHSKYFKYVKIILDFEESSEKDADKNIYLIGYGYKI